MENFVKLMIAEHAELVIRINKLEKFIYSDKSDKVNKTDFANMCIQLRAMRTYEEALRARLDNQKVVYTDEGGYYSKITHVDFDEDINTPNDDDNKTQK